MNTPWLLIPPIAIVVVFALVWLQSLSFRAIAAKSDKIEPGKYKAYACGEDVADHRVQPDYGQFFRFAFFFTIMHVVALVVTTVPPATGTFEAAGLAIAFVVSAAVALYVLFRR